MFSRLMVQWTQIVFPARWCIRFAIVVRPALLPDAEVAKDLVRSFGLCRAIDYP
jgi:hypothetical protein